MENDALLSLSRLLLLVSFLLAHNIEALEVDRSFASSPKWQTARGARGLGMTQRWTRHEINRARGRGTINVNSRKYSDYYLCFAITQVSYAFLLSLHFTILYSTIVTISPQIADSESY